MAEPTPRFPFPPGLDPDALLHSARLTLEPIHAAHAREMFDLWQDRRIYTFIPEDPPPSLSWLAQRYDKLTSRQSPNRDAAWLQWALRREQDQVLIGRIEASVRLDATAQLAWLLGTSYTGQGYAREKESRRRKSGSSWRSIWSTWPKTPTGGAARRFWTSFAAGASIRVAPKPHG